MEKLEIRKHPLYNEYGADRDGNVYSFKHNRVKQMTPCHHRRGYHQLVLSPKNNRRFMKLIHRIVWECWNNEIIPSDIQINHIDCNKTNNQLDNLELVTNDENRIKAMEAGIKFGRPSLI